jgi:hypothetical protein
VAETTIGDRRGVEVRIARVFPKRTRATPTDDLVFIGPPPLPEFWPACDEVHISCAWSWLAD